MSAADALQEIIFNANLLREIRERWTVVDPKSGEVMDPNRLADGENELREAFKTLMHAIIK